MRELEISSDNLVKGLLALASDRHLCLLDSCGVGHLGSHLLIAGIDPVETLEISEGDPNDSLRILEEKIGGDTAGIFTLSYDFGLKLEKIKTREKKYNSFREPDIYLALFDALVIHDYDSGKTFLTGNEERFDSLIRELTVARLMGTESPNALTAPFTSNFTKDEYIEAVEKIKECIRAGDTYQANLTQQLRVDVPDRLGPECIFRNLRRDHPAPFAAFIRRPDSTVISASPERFFKVYESVDRSRVISTSPIKGTRPRGKTPGEDGALRYELLTSEKDRAENVMIVDLLRNDIGRVCEFGSVQIEKLCDLEEHPSLFHLVSTVGGRLRSNATISEILRAVFPCGSITGAPKIRTMRIIDEIETANRGLSMGAIGIYIPDKDVWAEVSGTIDLSVAIRTMVISGREAVFNVGGGIVIDSDPLMEYEESLLKAQALRKAIGE